MFIRSRRDIIDGSTGRRWALDANDGVMTTTGAIQGFMGAGADMTTVSFAAAIVLITGALSLAAGTFAELAQERGHQRRAVERQQVLLARSPEEEFSDLEEHYSNLGLDAPLAKQVATQLTQRNALAAHLETDLGLLDPPPPAWQPWWGGFLTVLGFVSGALPLTVTVLLVSEDVRAVASISVVVICLTMSGVVAWASGSGTAGRAIARSLLTGLFVAVVAFSAGLLLEAIDQFVPQIDVNRNN